ncbi:hypothetical protein [Oryza sativa Japonica Group]|uniref:Uncharacterized protein n=1 Tax=Oryza sativa subsp. japonica TaxID=39947 RepID=Q5NBA6_ORYSJ|nr:hypothetical protein [Oryza sativa Japonica Group]
MAHHVELELVAVVMKVVNLIEGHKQKGGNTRGKERKHMFELRNIVLDANDFVRLKQARLPEPTLMAKDIQGIARSSNSKGTNIVKEHSTSSRSPSP